MENAHAEQAGARRIPVSKWEMLGVALLAGLAVFFLATSWRKWPDPLIDFGRELYLPWRLANGAVLYRDVDDFYGPLSQYFNAGLFALFGPGLMVLVTANLVIFAAILSLIYGLFRRAWGIGAALASSAVFISVFAFSQSVSIGNYNYATPYAHEATHGMLVGLLLVARLVAWVERPTAVRSFVVGGLWGLTAVLKPEIMLAAGLVMLAAIIMQRRRHQSWPPGAILAWAAGAVLPTVAFALFFSTQVPWASALALACRAWWILAGPMRFASDPSQLAFMGFDHPWVHLREHAGATGLAVAIVAAIAAGAWLVDRTKQRRRRIFFLGAVVAGIATLSSCWIPWEESGRSLFGLTLIYLVICAAGLAARPEPGASAVRPVVRLLIAVFAAALMSRMLLNGRIQQFGFVQAALAALLVPAITIGEIPGRLGLGRWGRAAAAAACLGLIVPGVVIMAGRSQRLLRWITHPVGEGADRFYTFVPEKEPTGDIVAQTSSWLRQAAGGRAQTLLVLPDGVMINYLARLPSPVAPFIFFSAATAGDREAAIVRELEHHPPDWVAIVSRDLREYGIQRYGERPDQGGQIMAWVTAHYETAAELGGDPLDVQQRGGLILGRRP
jgi:hypothetical protein